MSSIQPFQISIPEDKLHRLRQKLLFTDYPVEVDDAEPWSLGPPVSEIKRLVEYWVDGYDWCKAESHLNTFPQYTTQISVDDFGNHNVHFIHQPSEVPDAIPLLFVHGWPGSFIEVTKILPLLIKGGQDFPAFHVVAPSLINFGFSDASAKKGFAVAQHAETCHKLMLQLGYNEYVTQGGDLGYHVTRWMAKLYPRHVCAHHVNMAIPNPPPDTNPDLQALTQSSGLTEPEKAGLRRSLQVQSTGMGYFAIQSTKPQTISVPLTDSPAGLLAWIYDALYTWSDRSSYNWSDDEILTWISIYYFSKSGVAASVRIYYDETSRGPMLIFKQTAEYTDVPMGIAHFPQEIGQMPRSWNKTMAPVVHESEWDKGGHFAAWERPEDLVVDLRRMFGKGGGAEGVVKGKSGYMQ